MKLVANDIVYIAMDVNTIQAMYLYSFGYTAAGPAYHRFRDIKLVKTSLLVRAILAS